MTEDADAERDEDRESDHEATAPADEAEEETPLSGLRERVEARREAGEASPFAEIDTEASAEGGELFEEVDVADVDTEEVWDAVVEGEQPPEDLLEEEPAVDTERAPAPDEHVINKREYCQRCEFFAAPPDATCTNAGTEIVEMLDSDQFRVRNCPKVAADDEALSGFVSEE
ncbi:hypothetical protein [Halolamina salifodinae]|uniref:DUF8135 domain-containing protein n=1 Tax=Halolamina salifodinae TaxID=1202767 RepID=A0A8T4H0H7_9EURY|nr:hypothetical protein [Halolamina salifodinae]MBP1987873.1 hypothetical protein [Halolamina salifodinae]